MDKMTANLRYITADHLGTPECGLDGAAVVGRGNVTLGTLAGALIDPLHRHVQYLVFECRGWLKRRRYVLPLDLTRLDRARRALLVDADITDVREFPSQRFAAFSDDDLITAMFSPRAA